MEEIELLSEEDKEFLTRKNWDYDATLEGGQVFIVIHNFKLPERLTPNEVDLLIQQPQGYPEVGMDMFWTFPEVLLKESNSLPQATEDRSLIHLNKTWQRWSRHHNNSWRPNVDNLETFMYMVMK